MVKTTVGHVAIQLRDIALRGSDSPSDDESLSVIDVVLCVTAMIFAFLLGAITFNLLTFHSTHSMKEPKRVKTEAKRPVAHNADESQEASSEPDISVGSAEKHLKHQGPKSRTLARPQMRKSVSNFASITRPSLGPRSAEESTNKEQMWSRWKRAQSSEKLRPMSRSEPDDTTML